MNGAISVVFSCATPLRVVVLLDRWSEFVRRLSVYGYECRKLFINMRADF